jgi:hypothetical protein
MPDVKAARPATARHGEPASEIEQLDGQLDEANNTKPANPQPRLMKIEQLDVDTPSALQLHAVSYAGRAEAALTLDEIEQLIDGGLGTFDVACPCCGPQRHSLANRVRRVLRIWRIEPGYATYPWARCGEMAVRAIPRQGDLIQLSVSGPHWLWSQRQPISRTIADRYLRLARGYLTRPRQHETAPADPGRTGE